MYARGILFGTMKYELGDHAYIKCPETGLVADLEFKTKGYFSGTYNAIGGFIKDAQGNNLYELSGLWNEEMYIKDLTVSPLPFCRIIALYQQCPLKPLRRVRKSSFSMRHIPSIHHRPPDPSKNRKNENHNDSGMIQRKLSSREIRTRRLKPKPKSKIGNEKRQRSATMRALIGSHSFSGGCRAAREELMKAKKIWTGSSTLKC